VRVLHIQKTDGIGGCERHLLALLPSLSASGVEVRMCVAGTGQFHRFTDPLEERGIDTVVLPAGPDLNPALYRRLVREIRRFRPDVVHTHLVHADVHGQLAARASRVATVSSMHGTHPFFAREPYRTLYRAVGRLPRRTIAISHHVRRFLEELRFADPAKIRVIPYGIDSSGWLLSSRERAVARAGHALDGEDVAVGIASRLVPEKGHAVLLAAAAKAVREAPRLRVLIAGEGPLRGELERRAGRLPGLDARFLGFVGDVRSFMNVCDVFVFPTLPAFGEGFGLAALEAMAAGRPVVASAVPPVTEVVEDAETGILIEPGSVDALARALVRLGTAPELRQRMGASARRRAREAFAAEAMVRRTLDAYAETCSGEVRA